MKISNYEQRKMLIDFCVVEEARILYEMKVRRNNHSFKSIYEQNEYEYKQDKKKKEFISLRTFIKENIDSPNLSITKLQYHFAYSPYLLQYLDTISKKQPLAHAIHYDKLTAEIFNSVEYKNFNKTQSENFFKAKMAIKGTKSHLKAQKFKRVIAGSLFSIALFAGVGTHLSQSQTQDEPSTTYTEINENESTNKYITMLNTLDPSSSTYKSDVLKIYKELYCDEYNIWNHTDLNPEALKIYLNNASTADFQNTNVSLCYNNEEIDKLSIINGQDFNNHYIISDQYDMYKLLTELNNGSISNKKSHNRLKELLLDYTSRHDELQNNTTSYTENEKSDENEISLD